MLSGETQKLNMFQAINHGLHIALENDPRSGKNFYSIQEWQVKQNLRFKYMKNRLVLL